MSAMSMAIHGAQIISTRGFSKPLSEHVYALRHFHWNEQHDQFKGAPTVSHTNRSASFNIKKLTRSKSPDFINQIL
jgi:hypothetical protein